MSSKLKCPVCGTPLSQREFDKALGLWKDKQEHIKHLQEESKKLREEKKLFIDKYKKEKESLQKQFKKQLASQKTELDRTFNNKLKTELKKGIDAGVKEQKKAFIKQTTQLRQTENKMKQLQNNLQASAERYQKANEEIKRLKSQIEKGITPQIEGLLEEKNLLSKLQELYPKDKFIHTGKGGDIIQSVIDQGKVIGIIVYECKKVKSFDKKHILQAKEARRIRGADFAVLVTNSFPSKKQFYFVEKSVFVISPISLEPITYTLRESLLRISILKISNEAKQKAVQKVYDFLSSNEYNNRVNDVSAQLIDLGQELKKEIDLHKRIWMKRYNSYRSIYDDVGRIDYKLKELVQRKIDDRSNKSIELTKSNYLNIKELK